jgi:hypothetical protein
MALLHFNDVAKKSDILHSRESQKLQTVLIEIWNHPGYQRDFMVLFTFFRIKRWHIIKIRKYFSNFTNQNRNIALNVTVLNIVLTAWQNKEYLYRKYTQKTHNYNLFYCNIKIMSREVGGGAIGSHFVSLLSKLPSISTCLSCWCESKLWGLRARGVGVNPLKFYRGRTNPPPPTNET